jgi:FXSXX-COOH protein
VVLVDLTAVSLAALRDSVDPVLEQSKSRMLSEAGDPWLEALKLQSAASGSSC